MSKCINNFFANVGRKLDETITVEKHFTTLNLENKLDFFNQPIRQIIYLKMRGGFAQSFDGLSV